jgi:hypothetical protein
MAKKLYMIVALPTVSWGLSSGHRAVKERCQKPGRRRMCSRRKGQRGEEHSEIIDPKPEFSDVFEVTLHKATVNDPSATTVATEFGRLILQYALSLDPNRDFDGELLRRQQKSFLRQSTRLCLAYILSGLVHPSQMLDLYRYQSYV